MSFFKCGRDSTSIKCRTCIVGDSCGKEVRWFRKKAEMEDHLQKAHDIRVILPRGLKIEEEYHSFFTNYKRQWSIRRFLDPKLKYDRSRQSYMRTLGHLVVWHSYSTIHDHCIINDERFHVLHISTQPNGTNCGYYVMQTIRMLVEEFIQGF